MCNRSQSVVGNNIASNAFKLSSGVPQGLVLALILFTLYVVPRIQIVNIVGINYHLYADDV